MNVALIGKQQDINELTQEVKQNDFFRLFGTYYTDTKVLKVNKSSIISPFGLINHADCVIFQKQDDHSFNLMIEAVKSSKSLLLLNPHELTLEETNELLKVSDEAETQVFAYSHYKHNDVISHVLPALKECKLWEIELVGIENKPIFELTYLLDMVLSLTTAGIRRNNTIVVLVEGEDYVLLTLEFDNGKVALLNYKYSSGKKFGIKGYSDKKRIEVFPAESKAIMYVNGSDDELRYKPKSNCKAMLEEFCKNLQSEDSLLTSMVDFHRTQKIIEVIKEKKALLE